MNRVTRPGFKPDHAAKIAQQQARLDTAQTPGDMNVPGWKMHPLHGTLQGHFTVWVSGNRRLMFAFEDGDAILIDYLDSH